MDIPVLEKDLQQEQSQPIKAFVVEDTPNNLEILETFLSSPDDAKVLGDLPKVVPYGSAKGEDILFQISQVKGPCIVFIDVDLSKAKGSKYRERNNMVVNDGGLDLAKEIEVLYPDVFYVLYSANWEIARSKNSPNCIGIIKKAEINSETAVWMNILEYKKRVAENGKGKQTEM
jgi:hypothetical protein